MTTTQKTKPAARALAAAACPAEALLRKWAALNELRPATPGRVRYARNSDRHDKQRALLVDASQVLARSQIGAAFQLLISITAWPWAPTETGDPEGIPDAAFDSITDGTDYKRRLEISAYFHLTRGIADVDLRTAERFLTGENVDGGGLMQWLKDAGSDVDLRQVL